MPILISSACRLNSKKLGGFTALYGALVLLSIHWAIVVYANSSYLEQFVSSEVVSWLYVCGTCITIIAFLNASSLLSRFGNVRLITILTVIEFCALLGMAFLPSVLLIVLCFILHQATAPLLLFGIDIFMEEMTGENEDDTGKRRGLLLSFMSLTDACAAFGMGKLLGVAEPQFLLIYTVSALVLIPFLIIIFRYFRNFCDPQYPIFRVVHGVRQFWARHDIRNVFSAHFLLQLFFSWMVIYLPLYLYSEIGFNWEEIGLLLFVGILAYVVFEFVIGYIADHYIGEKEMMAFGFLIIAIVTSWFAFLDHAHMGLWMIAMFVVRIGASLVEATTESYFFKHTQGRDSDLISLFRITRPLGYLSGALLGSIAILILPMNLLFVVLGIAMIPGMFFAMVLHDTK